MTSLVEELQRDALDWNIPVTQLLQKCRVVAAKLDVKELAEWVHLELDGYDNTDAPAPQYRKVSGIPQAFNPYHGYQPLVSNNDEMQSLLSSMPFYHPLAEIEHMISQSNEGLHFTYPPAVATQLRNSNRLGLQPSIYINTAQLKRIVEAVRGKILEWSLRLEAAGIQGAGMSFSPEEKQKAQKMVTYNIGGSYIQGNVGHSQVGTQNSTQHNVSAGFDVAAVQQIIATLKRDGEQLKLSPESADELMAELQTLEAQAASPRPKASIIREGLISLRSILEGATANVLAAPVLYEIGKLLR